MQKTALAMSGINLELTEREKTAILRGRGYVFRSRPLGRAGDEFSVDGKLFEIVDVSERTLATVARTYYTIDVFDPAADSIEGCKIMDSDRWEPEKAIYIHWFRPIASME